MRVILAGMITLVALVAVVSSAGQSSASKLARQTITFGTLGIVAGQTVRVSAIRGPEDQSVKVCQVDLSIFDIHGNRQAASSQNLDPGKGAFLDLARADIVPPVNDARAQVEAVVDVTSDSKDDKPGCHVATSVEIFDQTSGRTSTDEGALSLRDERNLAPVGATAQCWIECSLADSLCPPTTECWQNPISTKFLCCNGRPLQGWVPVN